MRIAGKEYRTIWYEDDVVKIIDQTKLPHNFIIKDLDCLLYTSPSPRDTMSSRMPSSA